MNEKTQNLVRCALFAALLAVCSQIAIPLPMISINLGLFAVHLAGAALGPKWGTASVLVFIALGACGVPVFVGFKGGLSCLFDKTGGYMLGYVFDALIVGLWARKFGYSFVNLCIGIVLGVVACYSFGTLWFMYLTGFGLTESLIYCVFPFLPGDAVKMALSATMAIALRRRMAVA